MGNDKIHLCFMWVIGVIQTDSQAFSIQGMFQVSGMEQPGSESESNTKSDLKMFNS